MSKIIRKINKLYNYNNGFHDIMSYFWVIIIKPFLTTDDSISIGLDLFIYDFCGIDIVHREDLLDEVDEVDNYFIFWFTVNQKIVKKWDYYYY